MPTRLLFRMVVYLFVFSQPNLNNGMSQLRHNVLLSNVQRIRRYVTEQYKYVIRRYVTEHYKYVIRRYVNEQYKYLI